MKPLFERFALQRVLISIHSHKAFLSLSLDKNITMAEKSMCHCFGI